MKYQNEPVPQEKPAEVEASDVDVLVMRLRPMDEAPRDGTKTIIKHRAEGNRYSLRWWMRPYSTITNCGAWEYFPGDDS